METLFVSRDAKLRQKENTLMLTVGGQRRSFPVEKIRHIVLLGESDLNSRFLTLCGKHGVRISVFDYYGYFKGAYEPVDRNPSGRVKLLQAKAILDKNHCMRLAKEIIRGAAHNIMENLNYYRYRGNNDLKAPVANMKRLTARIGKAEDSPTLMGIEGNIRQIYYAAWSKIDPALDFGPRIRRPPNNPVNCLISFLNQLCYTAVRHELSKTHLDETLSFLHSPGAGRASLSLDLSEPFKPVLADMLIFRMIRRGMSAENWYDQRDGVCLLTETGRRNAAEQFSLRLEERFQGRSFREWIYRESLAIEKDLLDVAEYESFKRKA